MNVFIPLQKADLAKRQVWGFAAVEQPDRSNPPEIMDYETSKAHFLSWSDSVQKASFGKSLGNVRAQHGGQMLAVGRVIHLEPRDSERGFYVGVEVVDDEAWKKVEKGVYTGFSIGGSYGKKWPDAMLKKAIRYTALPNELSLVDYPCIPDATFEVVKADGQSELRKFAVPEDDDENNQGDDPENAPPAAEENDDPQPTESAPSGVKDAPDPQAGPDVNVINEVVVGVLMDLGLVQPGGSQPMSMSVRMDDLQKQIINAETGLGKMYQESLSKAISDQKEYFEKAVQGLASDIAQLALAHEALEKRGGPGPVIRDMGAVSQSDLADLQKAATLKDMLDKVDPATRQALQAEITRLEIKVARSAQNSSK